MISKIAAVFRLVIFAAVLSLGAEAAHAEEGAGKTIGDFLRGFLAGAPADEEQAPSPAPGSGELQRRVPFGRSEIQLSFAPLVEKTAPAVVNVYAARQVQARSPFAGDPFFEQFFGHRFNGPPRVQKSLGSGVLVDPSGIVVTNNHVVAGADEVKVALSDGREFESRILLKDESSDLAILKIDAPAPLPVLTLGNSDELKVGDLVLAVGNPFGVGQTVTSGIVSALARTRVGISDLDFFIQTDAAINPGNSGGALIDMAGRLVGINSAIYSRSGGSIGIGFAIPSNMVHAVVETAKRGGERFERPYVGATFQPVTPDVAESLGLDHPSGALVNSVSRGSPADEAGLKVGDVVESVDGVAIADPDALQYRLSTAGIGHTVEFGVISRGRTRTISVALEQAPETVPPDERTLRGNTPLSGLKVVNLSPRNARDFRLPPDSAGVVVAGIYRNSPAMRLDIRPGDIIRKVNGQVITSTADLEDVLGRGAPYWQVEFERNGMTIRQFVR